MAMQLILILKINSLTDLSINATWIVIDYNGIDNDNDGKLVKKLFKNKNLKKA